MKSRWMMKTYTRNWKKLEDSNELEYEEDSDESQLEHACESHELSEQKNEEGRKYPDDQTDFDAKAVILEYLELFRTKQMDLITNQELREFTILVLSDKQVLSTFTTQIFINHMLSLEEKFFENKDRSDFAQHYYTVIESIDSYVGKKDDLTDEEKKVIFYSEFSCLI